MKIISIEPTPSPNTMKINLDEALPGTTRNNYTNKNKNEAPDLVQQILEVDGVKGVYHVADFLALERNPRVDWKLILPKVRGIFGESVNKEEKEASNQQQSSGYGEIKVHIQKYKDLPMQVKLTDGDEEKRFGLPDRFQEAVLKLKKASVNVVMERKWVEDGVRYGEMEEIGVQVVEELSALFDKERLQQMVDQLLSRADKIENREKKTEVTITLEMLDDPDWKKRYAALEQLDPKLSDLPLLQKAIKDEKASIRRLAVVYLGMIEDEQILPLLYDAVLHDPSVTVRRTAGDCLSDIGSPKAIPTMMESLKDSNKLVRWRAAMFLYEVGDESAIEALKEAQFDSEFEVAMQIKLALKRIEGGKEAEGSVWKQMTESIGKKE